MKKFRLLLLLVFGAVALVSCEDTLEDENTEEENDEVSCIIETKKNYDKNGNLESYTNYYYDKKLLTKDSTFNKNNVLLSVNLREYDANNRLIVWETYRSGSLYLKSEYNYSGSSQIKKTYYMSNTTGRLLLWQETHYEGKNETLWIYYKEDGTEEIKEIYTYEGNLRIREEWYNEGTLYNIIINSYENNLLKEKKTLGADNQLYRSMKYFYEGELLVRFEEYNESSVMVWYKIYTKTGTNSTMEQTYYMPNDVLSSTISKEYNTKNDLIYQKTEYTDGSYIESSYQITYNECDCKISSIFRHKEIYPSNPQSNKERYSHYENEGVKCGL